MHTRNWPGRALREEHPTTATVSASFSAVAVSAAPDVFELVAPSNSRVAIRSISLGNYSDAGDVRACSPPSIPSTAIRSAGCC